LSRGRRIDKSITDVFGKMGDGGIGEGIFKEEGDGMEVKDF